MFQVFKETVKPRVGWGPAKSENRLGRYAAEDILQEVAEEKRRRLSSEAYDNWSFISPDSISLRPPSYISVLHTNSVINEREDTTLKL